MVLYGTNPLIGGCITSKAGNMLNLMNKAVAKGIGEASSDAYSFLRGETEKQVELKPIRGSSVMRREKPSARETERTQGMQEANRAKNPQNTINGKVYGQLVSAEEYDESVADRMNSSTWYGRGMNLFDNQGYGGDVYGLSAEEKSFWGLVTEGAK